MKGIVFNILEEVVVAEYGEETWETLLDHAAVAGVYTSLGNYPDEDLYRLAGAASEALGTPIPDVVRWVGRKALPLFAARFPQFFTPHRTTRSMVMSLNDIIHPEVRKVYPGAETPEFDFEPRPGGGLGVTYRSRRKLCAFALGLIEGAAEHYGETVQIVETACAHRGAAHCTFELAFAAQRVAA